MREMSFRSFLETNVPGVHNDGAGGFSSNPDVGAVIDSIHSGSETMKSHLPGLPSTDMVFQDLENLLPAHVKAVSGQIIHIDRNSTPLTIKIDSKPQFTNIHLTRDQYDLVKRLNTRPPEVGYPISAKFFGDPHKSHNVQILQVKY